MTSKKEKSFCFCPVTIADKASLSFVERLYESAFPPEERRAFSAMISLLENALHFHLLLLCRDDDTVGFLSYWQWECLAYIEHFAVSPDCRGQGIGSCALGVFCGLIGKPVVLETEPPVDEVSRRRIDFYQRAGFFLAPRRYVQPPYGAGLPPVELLLMAYGAVDWQKDFDFVRDLLHREVYGAEAGRYV